MRVCRAPRLQSLLAQVGMVGITPRELSLVALGGPARVARTTGLRWPLVDRELPALAGLGVSNVVEDTPASVELTDGVVAVVVPHEPAPGPSTPQSTDREVVQ